MSETTNEQLPPGASPQWGDIAEAMREAAGFRSDGDAGLLANGAAEIDRLRAENAALRTRPITEKQAAGIRRYLTSGR